MNTSKPNKDYTPKHRVDITNMISIHEIETLKAITFVGDEISFVKQSTESQKGKSVDGLRTTRYDHITGHVTAKYPNIFMLDNGRSYTWKDYIMGNFKVKGLVEQVCKTEYLEHDTTSNMYSYRFQRY